MGQGRRVERWLVCCCCNKFKFPVRHCLIMGSCAFVYASVCQVLRLHPSTSSFVSTPYHHLSSCRACKLGLGWVVCVIVILDSWFWALYLPLAIVLFTVAEELLSYWKLWTLPAGGSLENKTQFIPFSLHLHIQEPQKSNGSSTKSSSVTITWRSDQLVTGRRRWWSGWGWPCLNSSAWLVKTQPSTIADLLLQQHHHLPICLSTEWEEWRNDNQCFHESGMGLPTGCFPGFSMALAHVSYFSSFQWPCPEIVIASEKRTKII